MVILEGTNKNIELRPGPLVTSDPLVGANCRFEHLSDNICRFPVAEDRDGHVFCCRPATKKGYCDPHYEFAHVHTPKYIREPRALQSGRKVWD